MFKSPPEKRSESLTRMTRNRAIYLAVFDRSDQIKVKVIYELSPQVVVAEAIRKLDRSRNAISHVSFFRSWAAREGRVVYGDKRKRGRRLGIARTFARLSGFLTAKERSLSPRESLDVWISHAVRNRMKRLPSLCHMKRVGGPHATISRRVVFRPPSR